MERTNRIIGLLQILSEPIKENDLFDLAAFEQHQQRKHAALRALAQMQADPAVRNMMIKITNELPDPTRDQILRRTRDYAMAILPTFLNAQAEEAGLSNREKFLREHAADDPFLEDVNLTADSYAGKSEIEPDASPALDERGNVRQ